MIDDNCLEKRQGNKESVSFLCFGLSYWYESFMVNLTCILSHSLKHIHPGLSKASGMAVLKTKK